MNVNVMFGRAFVTTDLDAIRTTAKADYFAKKGKYCNPYPPNSPEFNAYERGWMQSLKADGARLVEIEGNSVKPRPKPTTIRMSRK